MNELKKVATRESFGKALVALGKKNKDVVALDADLAGSTKTALFQKAYSDRFFDCGIAEANMMGIAAGLATCGKIPYAATFAMFAAGRAYEQVRNSIGYPHLNVKIGATHAGLSAGEDGASHQCVEDIALMRVIPGMTVICPADDVEAYAATIAAAEMKGPCYLRFSRHPSPVFNDAESYKFELGKGVQLREGDDITLVATGLMVWRALEAAEMLAAEGVKARVINIHTIKPIDREILNKAANETKGMVTCEEHNVIGGLFGAVSEVLVQEGAGCKILPVAVMDTFGQSGEAEAVMEHYGLTAKNIYEKAKNLFQK